MTDREGLFSPLRDGLLFDVTSHCYPSRAYGSCREILRFDIKTNHYFGYVHAGEAKISTPVGFESLRLQQGMYFSFPGPLVIEPEGEVVVFERYGYRGLSMAGGPLEKNGRLSYIDHCTTSLIVPPSRVGDPCLNQLCFPPRIKQSMHTHPTVRIGLVYEGYGVCYLNDTRVELKPGLTFYLPAHQPHCFESLESSLGVIAFHPDTDTGPTDESHPMLNRTYLSRK